MQKSSIMDRIKNGENPVQDEIDFGEFKATETSSSRFRWTQSSPDVPQVFRERMMNKIIERRLRKEKKDEN